MDVALRTQNYMASVPMMSLIIVSAGPFDMASRTNIRPFKKLSLRVWGNLCQHLDTLRTNWNEMDRIGNESTF